jgi:Tol biopolymer transport system component
VEGFVRWHPNGQQLCYVWDGSVVLCKTGNASFKDRFKRLTHPTNPSPLNLVWSPDGKTLAFNRTIANDKGEKTKQIFIVQP